MQLGFRGVLPRALLLCQRGIKRVRQLAGKPIDRPRGGVICRHRRGSVCVDGRVEGGGGWISSRRQSPRRKSLLGSQAGDGVQSQRVPPASAGCSWAVTRATLREQSALLAQQRAGVQCSLWCCCGAHSPPDGGARAPSSALRFLLPASSCSSSWTCQVAVVVADVEGRRRVEQAQGPGDESSHTAFVLPSRNPPNPRPTTPALPRAPAAADPGAAAAPQAPHDRCWSRRFAAAMAEGGTAPQPRPRDRPARLAASADAREVLAGTAASWAAKTARLLGWLPAGVQAAPGGTVPPLQYSLGAGAGRAPAARLPRPLPPRPLHRPLPLLAAAAPPWAAGLAVPQSTALMWGSYSAAVGAAVVQLLAGASWLPASGSGLLPHLHATLGW